MSRSRWSAIGVGALLVGGCVKDARTYEAPDLPPALRPSELESTSWDVCRMLGPAAQSEGIYGTDLGYTTPLPDSDKLAVLFGDTWSEAGDACQYPVTPADDLQATLPRTRPEELRAGKPSTDAKDHVCAALEYTIDDPKDPQSWRRIRLFASREDRDVNVPLETGALRTPVAAWTTHRQDDEGASLYAMFSRGDAARCDATSDCPEGMLCSNDEAHGAQRLGLCTQTFELSEDPMPKPCRDDDDCGTASSCNLDVRAMCITDRPFSAEHDGERVEPRWYKDDARLGVAQTMYIARAAWTDRAEDYLIEHHFVTRRFVNVVARSVAHFDPNDPTANDYRPGDHTLLMWGRPEFVGTKGAQSLPFFLYVPLAELEGDNPSWQPRFFAGYGDDGGARWSEIERDAVPIYGTEAEVLHNNDGTDTIAWQEPELDYVNQMSVTFVEPLQRFVMLYGGDVPAWLVMDEDGTVPPPLYPAPSPGAIHQRSARHPWGRATQSDPKEDAWSSPEPVLTRKQAAPYLACGDDPDELPGCTESDEHGPFDLLATIAGLAADEPSETLDITADCIEGSAALTAQTAASGDSVGRLYGVSVIEEWTADVTKDVRGLAEGERAAEVYWNVSTWNPYQVVLMKTQLRGKPLSKPEK